MKITILLDEPYPFGMACTNRVHLYAKGLMELGNDIQILIPKPTEDASNIKNTISAGIYEGVKFIYAFKRTIRSKSFIGRRIHDLISYCQAFLILLQIKPDIILIVSNRVQINILAKVSSIILKSKLLREKSEVPCYRKPNISKFRKIILKFEYRLFDGLLVISKELKKFYTIDLTLQIKILEIPILVENTKIKEIETEPSMPERNFVYTGSLIDYKDGVLTIIRAFSLVVKQYPDVNLIMTGDLKNSPEKENILSLIEQLSIGKKVKFTGYISKKQLNDLTSAAIALISAKPLNRQNRYNMATKIGEYLLTGRPVITSEVDPVCDYLAHRENAFIVEPEENSIAREMEYILNNSEESIRIGLEGKKIALSFFDYTMQAIRINQFLREL